MSKKMLGSKKFLVWNKNLVQNVFGTNKISGLKIWALKILGPEKSFGLKKTFWRKKNWGQNKLGVRKNRGSKRILIWKKTFKKILGPKKFWVWKNFGLKKMLSPKRIWVQKKFFSKKNLGPKKILGPKKFWVQINVVSKKISDPKKFRSKIILSSENNFWFKKLEYPKEFFALKICAPNKFLLQNILIWLLIMPLWVSNQRRVNMHIS